MVRPAGRIEYHRRNAPTLANYCAMLVHVLHVRIWGLFKAASVAESQLRGDASIPTTILAGAVARSAETLCLAASIPARGHVMRDYAVPAKSGLMLDVTAGRSKRRLSVANVETRRTVRGHLKITTMGRWSNPGQAYSTAETYVRGPTTVANTFVKSNAIHNKSNRPTVLDLPMLYSIVLVARHHFQKRPAQDGHLAKILFPIAPKNVQESCVAAIRAGRSATLVNACPV